MAARDIDNVVKCSLLLTVAANTGRKLQISEWQVPSPWTPRVETLHTQATQGAVKTKDDHVISQKSQPKSHEIDSSQKEEG